VAVGRDVTRMAPIGVSVQCGKGAILDRTGLKLVLEGRFETSAPLHMGSGEEARDYLSAVGLEAGRVKTLFFFSTP
jgi:hypothetical protein